MGGSPANDIPARLAIAAQELWSDAYQSDHDGADPNALCEPLRRSGLFVDALPPEAGGLGLATTPQLQPLLTEVLLTIGGCDLSAGRLFEGHINAVKLVFHYGADRVRQSFAEDVRAGAIAGVWNAEAPPGLKLSHRPDSVQTGQLSGVKIYASGLGLVSRPLITARDSEGAMWMLAPPIGDDLPTDLSKWLVRGMRATATGDIDFTGLPIRKADIVGGPNDYYRSPVFKGGAWRFAAVQTGAILRLARLMRDELHSKGRAEDPHQRARIGKAAIAAQTAELWVKKAAEVAEDGSADPDAVDAYVGLARLAVEQAGLEVVALIERGIGLAAFTRPSPIDRIIRDLTTYLRQPFPDGVLAEAASYLTPSPSAEVWSVARTFPE